MVVLTGLHRDDINGKTATVISVDHAEGKALVKVEVMDRTFKIKVENLKMEEVGEVEEFVSVTCSREVSVFLQHQAEQ